MESEIEIDDAEVEFDRGFIDLDFKNLGRRGIDDDDGSESLYYNGYHDKVIPLFTHMHQVINGLNQFFATLFEEFGPISVIHNIIDDHSRGFWIFIRRLLHHWYGNYHIVCEYRI
jgi:hypothetical protein